jgi:predicted O-methyltransferase YrrM
MIYFLKAKTRYGIHSPFVFKLVNEVFRDRKPYPAYKQVEAVKKRYLKSREIIEVSNFGANTNTRKHAQPVRGIARCSSISEKDGRLLFRLVRFFQPQTMLELGTNLGIGTLYLHYGMPNAAITTIEGSPEICSLASETFRQQGIKNISPVNGQFDDVIRGVVSNIPQIDFLFLDGDHTFEATVRNFEICAEKASENTVFVIHDIHWSKGMERAWQMIKASPKTNVTIDLFTMGIVVFSKVLSKQHYTIRY